MSAVTRVLNSPWAFWLLLSMPAAAMLSGFAGGGEADRLLGPAGEFAARMLIIALMLTPLRTLLPQSRALAWLAHRRRYFGVAAFGYASLHLAAYLIDAGSLATVTAELAKLGILVGWLAFVAMVPLAITSNEPALRWLGTAWKPLQRLAYVVALAVLAHWLLVSQGTGGALVHFLPLAALEAYRLIHNLTRISRRRHSPA